MAWIDGLGVLRVGPESAGAVPGPACYGRGGERATLTDAFLVSGDLWVERIAEDDEQSAGVVGDLHHVVAAPAQRVLEQFEVAELIGAQVCAPA